jgi:hypothetical protein
LEDIIAHEMLVPRGNEVLDLTPAGIKEEEILHSGSLYSAVLRLWDSHPDIGGVSALLASRFRALTRFQFITQARLMAAAHQYVDHVCTGRIVGTFESHLFPTSSRRGFDPHWMLVPLPRQRINEAIRDAKLTLKAV